MAQAYQKLLPEPLQLMVGSFFANLDDLYTGANNLLQAKPKEALVDFSRFVVNSTLGFAGVADVASGIGMPKHDEDLGQTLGLLGGAVGALPGRFRCSGRRRCATRRLAWPTSLPAPSTWCTTRACASATRPGRCG